MLVVMEPLTRCSYLEPLYNAVLSLFQIYTIYM